MKTTYTYTGCIGDRIYGVNIADGTRVRKCNGPGLGRNAPKPFTYVEDAESGRFLGMVLRGSLTIKKAGK